MESNNNKSGDIGLAIVACAVLEDEVKLLIERLGENAGHIKRIEIVEMGLHDQPEKLHVELQELINKIEADKSITHIALVFGLCSRSTENISSTRCDIIIPRAHDCVTLLLGDKDQYADYVEKNPGTYWFSHGWIKNRKFQDKQDLYNEYVEKYGADNAAYLMQIEQGWIAEYDRAVYVDMGLFEPNQDIKKVTQLAEKRDWKFEQIKGSSDLLEDLLASKWDDQRFVILHPGETVKMTGDRNVIDKK